MQTKPPKFSVIIPVYSAIDQDSLPEEQRHYRGKQVQRAIKSVINQQFPDWELILVDDGCTDETPRILDKFAETDKRIKVIHKENENRAVARNRGMEEAKGEWICWMDSDDEYSSHYLRELDIATQEFPGYKVFNFGSIIYFPDHYTAIRSVFAPAEEGQGHEYFKSGQIGCGSFIFRRDLWADNQEKYRIPDELNPYQFAATSGFDMRFDNQEPDIEHPAEAFTDNVYRHGLSLGNPWGDDFLQFYLLTRDNKVKSLDVLLYIQYPRAHEEIYKHFGEIYE
jgi:glycosyltransferase involved in cell wall biosynthesis